MDASVREQGNQLGFGFVVRNHQMAKNGRLHGPLEALAGKALGCRKALVWIQNNGLLDVAVESDSKVLVSVVNKESLHNSYVGVIIKDCKSDCFMACGVAH